MYNFLENILHYLLFFSSVHTLTDSLFSTSSGFTNYRGLLNLCIVLLVLSNARVALENLLKYGILIDPFVILGYVFREPYHWPCIALLLASNVFINVCYFIELALSSRAISERLGVLLHVVNCGATLIFPAGVILVVHPLPFLSSLTLGYYTSLFLKMISYACVNRWCREKAYAPKRRKTLSGVQAPSASQLNGTAEIAYGDSPLQHYPENLTLKDLYYFICCPTLCYELNFPRTTRIRKRFLVKRVVEMLFMMQIIAALVQQWMIPTVQNSLEPFMNSNFSVMITRIFKLAIPNHFIWLLFFYWFFHSCLNVVAELLKFGDREFYKDWWNAETVQAFWQTWNVPVHRWGKRHLYVPMLKWGFTKFQASVTVFLVSAFFHEYLVSVPLRMFKLWSFMGMAGQIPFAMLVARFLHGKYGNMAVWLSLILGQPAAILMYVHDYYVLNR